MDPPKDLSEALKEKEIPEDSFFTMKHGETRVIKWKNDKMTTTIEKGTGKFLLKTGGLKSSVKTQSKQNCLQNKFWYLWWILGS